MYVGFIDPASGVWLLPAERSKTAAEALSGTAVDPINHPIADAIVKHNFIDTQWPSDLAQQISRSAPGDAHQADGPIAGYRWPT
jgi:hypothetical protein